MIDHTFPSLTNSAVGKHPIVGQASHQRAAARSDLEAMERVAHWLDTAFEVPGTRFRFGLDPIIGLIPGFGDLLGLVASIYFLYLARRFELPRVTVARMTINVAIDTLIGGIPLIGDLFDAFWKVNQRNLSLVKRHLQENHEAGRRRAKRSDQVFVVGVVLLLIAALAGCLAIFYWIAISIVQLIQSM